MSDLTVTFMYVDTESHTQCFDVYNQTRLKCAPSKSSGHIMDVKFTPFIGNILVPGH